MLVSYNEACAKDCSTLEKDLELCEKAGFDCIEIRLDMLKEYLKTHTLAELAGFFKNSRLRPHALNAVYLYPEFLSEQDDKEKQSSLMDEFLLGCEACRAIGSRYMIIVPFLQKDPAGGPYAGKKEDPFRSSVRILKELSERAQAYEVNLCFEIVGFDRSSVRSIKEADEIVKAVDRENVGFVLDSYNLYLNGGNNDFSDIRKIQPEKIFAVHLMSGDDVPAQERGQDKRCFCGQGVVDTDGFLKELKACGYNGMVSVETFRPEYWQKSPEWVIEQAYKTTYAALKKNGCI